MSNKPLRTFSSVVFLIFSISWFFLSGINHVYIFSFYFLIPFFISLDVSMILYFLDSYFDQKNKGSMTKSVTMYLLPKIILLDVVVLPFFFLLYTFGLGVAFSGMR